MPASKVMTLRIEPELLEQLRAAAKAERRSRNGGGSRRPPGDGRHLEAPDELAEFRRVRRSLSAHFEVRARRHPKLT